MLEINWNEGVVNDPVKLADYIELTIAIDSEHEGMVFTHADFVNSVQDTPYNDIEDSFLEGDEVDETKCHFEDALSLIERRRQWLGSLHPFVVDGDEVRLVPGSDRDEWTPYVFLLACSHYASITGKGPRLETEFEKICKEAMKALFSESADVFLFSQFSRDRAKLGRSAREAVKNLAAMLNTSMVRPEEDIPTGPNEFGIDIIAIDALDDRLGYPFFAFAQCTVSQSSREWGRKNSEARADHGLAAYILLNVQHPNFLFIPHLPREDFDTLDESVLPHEISNCVFCDRYRICKALHRLAYFRDGEPRRFIAEIIDAFLDSYGAKLCSDSLSDFTPTA